MSAFYSLALVAAVVAGYVWNDMVQPAEKKAQACLALHRHFLDSAGQLHQVFVISSVAISD